MTQQFRNGYRPQPQTDRQRAVGRLLVDNNAALKAAPKRPPAIPHPSALDYVIRPGTALGQEALARIQQAPNVGHPGMAESFTPVWGSGREAVADLQDRDYWGAAGNAVLAAADLVAPEKVLVQGVGKQAMRGFGKAYAKKGAVAGAKGAVQGAFDAVAKPGSHNWDATRKWMRRRDMIAPGMDGHHWAIEQSVMKDRPWLRKLANQPWNIKELKPEIHQAIHGNNPNLKFNGFQKIWYGTPDAAKSIVANTVGGIGRALDGSEAQ